MPLNYICTLLCLCQWWLWCWDSFRMVVTVSSRFAFVFIAFCILVQSGCCCSGVGAGEGGNGCSAAVSEFVSLELVGLAHPRSALPWPPDGKESRMGTWHARKNWSVRLRMALSWGAERQFPSGTAPSIAQITLCDEELFLSVLTMLFFFCCSCGSLSCHLWSLVCLSTGCVTSFWLLLSSSSRIHMQTLCTCFRSSRLSSQTYDESNLICPYLPFISYSFSCLLRSVLCSFLPVCSLCSRVSELVGLSFVRSRAVSSQAVRWCSHHLPGCFPFWFWLSPLLCPPSDYFCFLILLPVSCAHDSLCHFWGLSMSSFALTVSQRLSPLCRSCPSLLSLLLVVPAFLNAFVQSIRDASPFSLDQMDIYSNILFLNQNAAALSALAHAAMQIDKVSCCLISALFSSTFLFVTFCFSCLSLSLSVSVSLLLVLVPVFLLQYRPETCLILGNYYSMKGQPDKAVTYFKRALKLNPKCFASYVLIGHEYLEMKNPPAALDAYRTAANLNARGMSAGRTVWERTVIIDSFHSAKWSHSRFACQVWGKLSSNMSCIQQLCSCEEACEFQSFCLLITVLFDENLPAIPCASPVYFFVSFLCPLFSFSLLQLILSCHSQFSLRFLLCSILYHFFALSACL